MEDLVRIIRHERWSSVDQLIHEDAESIPVDGVRVALVLDNFRSNILWCTAERVGPLMLVHGLNEAKVGKFDVPIIGQQDILGFQISEDHILAVQVFQAQDDLRNIKLRVFSFKLFVLVQNAHQIAILHEIEIHVDNPFILGNAIQLEDERVVDVLHERNLIVQVFLLLVFYQLVFGLKLDDHVLVFLEADTLPEPLHIQGQRFLVI